MKQDEVTRATIGRIPLYLKYLRNTEHRAENISAAAIARKLGLGEVQVRKDLGAVSGAGRPKTGYNIRELVATLESFLGYNKNGHVIIVGAGKLGRALLDYGGFGEYGLSIIAAFDTAVTEPTPSHSGKLIYPMTDLSEFCRAHNVGIGVIAVPAGAAQQVSDQLVKCGVRAIWCFAPCTLNVPNDIPVQYENMGLSLAYLNHKI